MDVTHSCDAVQTTAGHDVSRRCKINVFKGLPNYLLQGTDHPPRAGGEGDVSSLTGFLYLLGSSIRECQVCSEMANSKTTWYGHEAANSSSVFQLLLPPGYKSTLLNGALWFGTRQHEVPSRIPPAAPTAVQVPRGDTPEGTPQALLVSEHPAWDGFSPSSLCIPSKSPTCSHQHPGTYI